MSVAPWWRTALDVLSHSCLMISSYKVVLVWDKPSEVLKTETMVSKNQDTEAEGRGCLVNSPLILLKCLWAIFAGWLLPESLLSCLL